MSSSSDVDQRTATPAVRDAAMMRVASILRRDSNCHPHADATVTVLDSWRIFSGVTIITDVRGTFDAGHALQKNHCYQFSVYVRSEEEIDAVQLSDVLNANTTVLQIKLTYEEQSQQFDVGRKLLTAQTYEIVERSYDGTASRFSMFVLSGAATDMKLIAVLDSPFSPKLRIFDERFDTSRGSIAEDDGGIESTDVGERSPCSLSSNALS